MDTHLTLVLHLQTYKILNVPVKSTTEDKHEHETKREHIWVHQAGGTN